MNLPRTRGTIPFHKTHTGRTPARPPAFNAGRARERDQARAKNFSGGAVNCLDGRGVRKRCAPRGAALLYVGKVWENVGGNGSCHGEARGSLPVLCLSAEV